MLVWSTLFLCWDEVGGSGNGRTCSPTCAHSSLCVTLNNNCLCSELILCSHFLKTEMGIRSTSNMFLQTMSNLSSETIEDQNKQPFEGCVRLPEMAVSVPYISILSYLLTFSHYSCTSSVWVSVVLEETRGHSGALCEDSRLFFSGLMLTL